jgi:hypothetical protein
VIAQSVPFDLDDAALRRDARWTPRFGLETMVSDMLQVLHSQQQQQDDTAVAPMRPSKL